MCTYNKEELVVVQVVSEVFFKHVLLFDQDPYQLDNVWSCGAMKGFHS